MEVGGLGMPLCCFPRVFLSSRSTLSSGRGGGASGRAFGARELVSVSSVHLWAGDPGVALLRWTPATFLARLVLPPHLCTLGEVLGRKNLRGFFLCSRLPLPPHLCTLGEVVGRVGLPSVAPVRVLPGLLAVLGSDVGTLWAWIVSFAVFPCTVAVRLLAVFRPLAVSQRSL